MCSVEVDNRGNRLIITDDSDINTPAVAAAYAVKRYSKQAQDEISFEVRKCFWDLDVWGLCSEDLGEE